MPRSRTSRTANRRTRRRFFGNAFLATLFKNRNAEEHLAKLNLNERQIKAVLYVVENGNITNSKYQEINGVSKPTATRDIKELVDKKIFVNLGTKGSSAVYELV